MALRDQPYLPLYIQDFLTDEKLAECSAEATGVYIRLMCLLHKSDPYGKILLKQKYKQTDKQILNFASQVAKNLPYDLLIIQRSLTELYSEDVIQIDGDFLYQKRMVKDSEISDKRASAGKNGGKSTQEKNKDFAKKFAKAKYKANTENEIDIENEDVINIDFDVFWSAYDKKVGDKDRLKKKWASLTTADRIKAMEHIPLYIASQPDKKFRKDPGTYLNNKSFNDEIIQSHGQSTVTGSGKAFNGRNGGFAIVAGQLKDQLRFIASGGTTDFGNEI